jgi:hypothetical protein
LLTKTRNTLAFSGFGGLVVSMLASGTQVRLPLEGKLGRLYHVADLRHVKEPYNYRGSRNYMLN